jgi:hypothetical protein
MHAYKRAKRVKPGIELFAQYSKQFDVAVYEALADEKIFEFHEEKKENEKHLRKNGLSPK